MSVFIVAGTEASVKITHGRPARAAYAAVRGPWLPGGATAPTPGGDPGRPPLPERHGALARDGQERAEAPEPAGRRREALGRQVREPRDVDLDREVDGDVLGAAARAAGEQAPVLVERAAAGTLEPDHVLSPRS